MEQEQNIKPENAICRFFHVREHQSTPLREIIGGSITFLAMCYILPVNAGILAEMGMSKLGVYGSTALVSAFVTLIMALVANCPISLSSGMGLNAYLTYTVCQQLNYSWQECMILLFITGILFFVFSLTSVRRKIIEAFPEDLKSIISAGLGGFIAFVGLKGSGIIVSSPSTVVSLGSLSDPVVLLSIGGIFLVFALMNIKTKRGILSSLALPIGMISVALIGVIMRASGVQNQGLPWADFTQNWGLKDFNEVAFFGLLSSDATVKKGAEFWTLVGQVFANPASYAVIFSLIFVNLFDTSATLMAIGKDTDIFGADGKMKDNKAIMADASGALICAPLGTATVTSFIESTIGVKLGARTGMASLTSAFLFLLSAFIYPVFQLFTFSCVSSAALVTVGGLIFASNLKSLKWSDPAIGFAAFMTILMVVLTYSLTNGIGFGLMTYIVIMLASKRGKEVSWILYAVSAFYVLSFAVNEIVKYL